MRRREAMYGYAFLALWLIVFFAFTVVPVLYSMLFSVSDVSVTGNGIETSFVGTKWYKYAFLTDAEFIIEFGETILFVVVLTPLIVIISMILAILLNGKFRGRVFFRALYFAPVVITSGPVLDLLLSNEAASIDGASKWQVFWKITLPFLKPTIMINCIYTIMELSSYASTAVNIKIKDEMFAIGRIFGYSSALTWIYTAFVLCFIAVVCFSVRERKDVA